MWACLVVSGVAWFIFRQGACVGEGCSWQMCLAVFNFVPPLPFSLSVSLFFWNRKCLCFICLLAAQSQPAIKWYSFRAGECSPGWIEKQLLSNVFIVKQCCWTHCYLSALVCSWRCRLMEGDWSEVWGVWLGGGLHDGYGGSGVGSANAVAKELGWHALACGKYGFDSRMPSLSPYKELHSKLLWGNWSWYL